MTARTKPGALTRAERLAAVRANPAFEQKRLANLRRALATPEARARRRRITKGLWRDATYAIRAIAGLARVNADPAAVSRRTAIAIAVNHGTFVCPPRLQSRYIKLRRALGVEPARAEIRAQLRREAGFEP